MKHSQPVGAHADVMHVELDSFRLLLVLEVIVGQQVEDLIDDWRSWGSALRKTRSLTDKTIDQSIK